MATKKTGLEKFKASIDDLAEKVKSSAPSDQLGYLVDEFKDALNTLKEESESSKIPPAAGEKGKVDGTAKTDTGKAPVKENAAADVKAGPGAQNADVNVKASDIKTDASGKTSLEAGKAASDKLSDKGPDDKK